MSVPVSDLYKLPNFLISFVKRTVCTQSYCAHVNPENTVHFTNVNTPMNIPECACSKALISHWTPTKQDHGFGTCSAPSMTVKAI